MISKLSTPLSLLSVILLFGFGLPGNIQKKVEKEVGKTFNTENFTLIPLTVGESLNEELPIRITGENLYKVEKTGELLGYAFVDQAPSKTAKFDYLVIFDAELKVVTSKVLVYREEYGGEIGSSRWLRQFNGLSGNDRVSPKTNIDAISGATISVRSMTRSMDNLLQTVGKLQENQVL
jgi:Na+-translocating ferredoxin:NAD+ oxidoreductase RnfG subunit